MSNEKSAGTKAMKAMGGTKDLPRVFVAFFLAKETNIMEETAAVKSRIRQYWNWRSVSYGLDTDRSGQFADMWKSVMQELAGDGCGRKALDLGTGTGQFAFYLTRQGYRVDGIDLSEKMIELAGKNAAKARLDIRFRTGDAERLELADCSVDLVVSRNLLWTLPSPERAVREWHRVLKPGGAVILSDGFWQNGTWSRIPGMAARVFRGLPFRALARSLRFVAQYSSFRKRLPYYQGMVSSDARMLMLDAGFRDIRFYDTESFGFDPYGSGKEFFIAHAVKGESVSG